MLTRTQLVGLGYYPVSPDQLSEYTKGTLLRLRNLVSFKDSLNCMVGAFLLETWDRLIFDKLCSSTD